jgi:imidazolonepropionase-like amidohydrolase
MRLVIRNCHWLDTDRMVMRPDSTITIEDGRIAAIGPSDSGNADQTIDAKGRFVIPGLIDAHVHFRLATMDFRKLASWSEVEYGIAMQRLSRETLQRGFTTVRDLGGDVEGLIRAIKAGMAEGPRIVRAGRMLTQTGGHGDAEGGPRPVPQCACEMRHTAFGIVSDGVDAVRKASRHNLRDGSDFLKIHVSGGVATPSDPLESIQYTKDEIAAVCQEARNRHTYVAAHAYSPESIRLAVENGVYTLEHGNLIDADAAALAAKHNAVLVPTLATYEAMEEVGAQLGLPLANRQKNKKVYEAGIGSIEIARKAGLTLGFGTDLIGETQARQNREFTIRAAVETPVQILHAMYVVGAKLCRLEGEIGTLKPGAVADLVICDKNPLDDIRALSNPAAFSHVIQAGLTVSRRDGT